MILTEGLEDKLQQILNDPNSMAQIMSLAQSFGLQDAQSTAPEPRNPPAQAAFSSSAPDIGFAQAIMGRMQQAQHTDGKQEALLCALKPFLKPERREKIDQAMRLARISHLAGFALKNYGGLLGQKGG